MKRKRSTILPLIRFGKYLKLLRVLKGVTQAEIASLLRKRKGLTKNVSQGLVAKYEAGNIHDPDPEVLGGLAKLYSVDLVEMIVQLSEEKYALRGKKWQTLKKSIPQENCMTCRLIKNYIGDYAAIHKH